MSARQFADGRRGALAQPANEAWRGRPVSSGAAEIAHGDLTRRVSPDDQRTEVGRLGASLNEMLTQIEQAFAARGESEERLRRFLSDASHELRTPLASIRGYAELFRLGAANEPEELERVMTRIEAKAARMGVLVENLLLLARLDELPEMRLVPVDLRARPTRCPGHTGGSPTA